MLQSTTERVPGIWVLTVGIAAVVMSLLSSCATNPSSPAQGTPYIGRGSGNTPLAALSEAKVQAVYQAAIGLLGEAAAAANRGKIEQAVRDAENPNAFVFNQTLKILKTGADPISYEIQIGVNLAALSETLQGLGIGPAIALTAPAAPGGSEGSDASPVSKSSSSPEPAGSASSTAPGLELSPRAKRDLDRMTYMVSFASDSSLEPFLIQSATTSADAYLADNAIPYVDSTQVEHLRKDQATVYEQETGKSVDILQWIAQRLRADVYIVIDGAVSGTSRDGRHYGSADVTLRIFETSTGSGMGAASYQSIQPSVSLTSQREAVLNALRASVYRAMGDAVRQAREAMARELASGIAYDLIVLNTVDDRAMSAFAKNLALRAGDVRLLSWSPQETRYRVTFGGTASDLQDLVYETSQAVPGFSGMGLVTLRGRELTFDTGM